MLIVWCIRICGIRVKTNVEFDVAASLRFEVHSGVFVANTTFYNFREAARSIVHKILQYDTRNCDWKEISLIDDRKEIKVVQSTNYLLKYSIDMVFFGLKVIKYLGKSLGVFGFSPEAEISIVRLVHSSVKCCNRSVHKSTVALLHVMADTVCLNEKKCSEHEKIEENLNESHRVIA